MLAKIGSKFPRIKVLVVHPSKHIRDRIAEFIEKTFACKVTTTTNIQRAINKLEYAANNGGPNAKFYVVISAYDIADPDTGLGDQGPVLVDYIRKNPLLSNIQIILEEAGHRVTEIAANAFVPTLDKMEHLA